MVNELVIAGVLITSVGVAAIVACNKAWRFRGMVEQSRRELAARIGGTPEDLAGDAGLRSATVRWMIVEHNLRAEDLDRLECRSDFRDLLSARKTYIELLPVLGFFGTVLPIAISLSAGGAAGGVDGLIASLATALWTTALGLLGFGVGALLLASAERDISWIERAVAVHVTRTRNAAGSAGNDASASREAAVTAAPSGRRDIPPGGAS